jgi:hypothetical protein
MARPRHLGHRFNVSLLLLVLALVPLLTSQHRYRHLEDSSATCRTCVVAFHGTTAPTAPVATPVPSLLAEAVTPASPGLVASAPAPIRVGRAPPAFRTLAA